MQEMLPTNGSSESVMDTHEDPDALGATASSVVLIGPEAWRRKAIAHGLEGPLAAIPRELPFYPDIDQVTKLIELNFDVVMIDLDANPEVALELVDILCSGSQATVMVYSTIVDAELMIRCMRAGARELLNIPLAPGAMAEAMVRASVRRSSMRVSKKPDSKLFVFWGAKGGSGVTTLATNFAISVAKESGKKTLLIDLDLPFGDAALGLGLTPQYSTADAVQNFGRLDSYFLSKLAVKHSSGLFVLSAPGKFVDIQVTVEAVDKLVAIARQDFDFVVVDSGSRLDLTRSALFHPDAMIFLISQVGIPELRNSNRLVSELFVNDFPKLEIVLNRFSPSLGIDEEHITKALTRRAQWKIPEDNTTARKMQNTATSLALSDTPISRAIRQMARAACGISPEPEKKKKIIGIF
jgi:pilus assembly protein CpaE